MVITSDAARGDQDSLHQEARAAAGKDPAHHRHELCVHLYRAVVVVVVVVVVVACLCGFVGVVVFRGCEMRAVPHFFVHLSLTDYLSLLSSSLAGCLAVARIVYRGCRVIFWDLGGQMKMRSIWEKYYQEAHAVVFVVDSADVGRLEEAKLAYGKGYRSDCT